MAESAAESDFAGGEARAISDCRCYPISTVVFDRQRRHFLNTRRALCVEPAERFLLALEWQELAAG